MTFSFARVAVLSVLLAACTPSAPKGVRIGKAERKDLVQRVTVSGAVAPARQTTISVPYSGFVRKLYVGLGDKVKKDDPLVSVSQALDSSERLFPLRAPYDGTVVQILKREGESVVASGSGSDTGNRILRVDDLSKFFVNAGAAEIDVVKLKVGLETVIRIASVPQRTYKGVIREIALAPTEQERWNRGQTEFACRIEILDADAAVKSGLTLNMDIVTAKKENVVAVPHEFVEASDDGFFVTMKSGERRAIKVGLRNEEDFEVTEGLKAGDEIQQVDFLALVLKEK